MILRRSVFLLFLLYNKGMKDFGNKIKQLRLKKGLTPKELAAELGVSSVSIFKWENSVKIPQIKNIIKLAMFFDVTTHYLLCDD